MKNADMDMIISPSFVLDRINDAIYLVNQELELVYINNKACRMLGYTHHEMTQLRLSDVDHELKDRDVSMLWWKLSMQPNGIRFTSQHRDRAGNLIPVEISSSHYAVHRPEHILCVVRDIRDIKQQTLRRLEQEQQFRSLVENTPELIARFDLNMRCVYVNASVLDLLGCDLRQAEGWKLTDCIPWHEAGMGLFKLVTSTLPSGKSSEGELALEIGGTQKVVHVRCVAEFDLLGQIKSILTIGRDITQFRETERQLRESHRQLRMLARTQNARGELERKHIAREVHDELGQHLTSLRVGLSLMNMQLAKNERGAAHKNAGTNADAGVSMNAEAHTAMQAGNHAGIDAGGRIGANGGTRGAGGHTGGRDPVDDIYAGQMANLMALVDSTIHVVRDISTRLRPNVLNMGLIPALEWLRDEFIRHNQCGCVLIAPDENDVRLDEESSTTVFRVVQESLTNVTRHAMATKVTLIVQLNQKTLQILIRDNGRGFRPERIAKNAFGLLGIRERVAMLNGAVTIDSAPGKGTLIRLTLPIG
ncbi:PAS domain-containing sensor histidine kinase [Acerihabitans arboris]|nr:PAS domain S-box protein [Acerihabitans arboris]